MLTTTRSSGPRSWLVREAPLAAGAVTVAELFFHWGSFALELLGFLTTWAALSLVARGILALSVRLRQLRLPPDLLEEGGSD